MGIKLGYLVLFLILISCDTLNKSESNDIGSTEEEEYYVRAFKKSVLMGCLNEITNNEFGKSLYFEFNDIGLYTEVAVLSHDNVNYAREMGSEHAKTLKPVNYPDVEGRTQGYSNCIDYAFYNEMIDSVAKVKYNNLKNAKMEYIYE